MKKNKGGDSKGIVIEMIQCGGEGLLEILVELFNDVMGPKQIRKPNVPIQAHHYSPLGGFVAE